MKHQSTKQKQLSNSEEFPHSNIQIEKAVLGAILLEDNEFTLQATHSIKDEYFSTELHKHVSNAITTLKNNDTPIETLTVFNYLKDKVEGITPFDVVELTQKIESSANIESHILILKELFFKRKALTLFQKAINTIDANADIFNVLQNVEKQLSEFDAQSMNNKTTLQSAVDNYIDVLEKKQQGEESDCISTMLSAIDTYIGGFKPQKLIIAAARPAMGKSAVMLQLAKNIAIQNKRVHIFSLEMSSDELCKRLISNLTKVNYSDVSNYNVSESDLNEILKLELGLMGSQFFIDDTADLTIQKMKAEVTRSEADVVFLDYIQLMDGDGYSRENEISKISRGLKKLSKQLNCTVVALSQLSRKVEERSDKRPLLSDLRESGAIEQDADAVLMFYRPEYYDITQDENGESVENMIEFIWRKNRSGATGSAWCEFKKPQMQIEDVSIF